MLHSQGFELAIKAVGLMEYQDYVNDYDVVLLGPQCPISWILLNQQ